MFDKLTEILAKQLRINRSQITRESRIKADLGADSLDLIQLLMTLEDGYDISIPDDKLASFVTVGDVCDYLDTVIHS